MLYEVPSLHFWPTVLFSVPQVFPKRTDEKKFLPHLPWLLFFKPEPSVISATWCLREVKKCLLALNGALALFAGFHWKSTCWIPDFSFLTAFSWADQKVNVVTRLPPLYLGMSQLQSMPHNPLEILPFPEPQYNWWLIWLRPLTLHSQQSRSRPASPRDATIASYNCLTEFCSYFPIGFSVTIRKVSSSLTAYPSNKSGWLQILPLQMLV